MKQQIAEHFLNEILPALLSSEEELVKVQTVSSLWAGFGSILRLHFKASPSKIVKLIAPPPDYGTTTDEGRLRKILSYQVETNFYKHLAPIAIRAGATVPQVYEATKFELLVDGKTVESQVSLLEDLSNEFPVFTEKRGTLNDKQIWKSIEWLAKFHGAFWDVETKTSPRRGKWSWCPSPLVAKEQGWDGEGLWQQGGYHYLSTRMAELEDIDPEWSDLGLNSTSDLAFAVDWCLNNPTNRRRLSVIHGDVKAANMAFDAHSERMAMYDFQYAGIALGVQDLAKFLTTSIPSSYLEGDGEERLLRKYHEILTLDKKNYPFEELWEDWELALVSWTRFLAGWSGGFWGNVDWLQSRSRDLLLNSSWTEKVLERYRNRPTSN